MSGAADRSGSLSPEALERLLAARQQFLGFIRKRVDSPEAAEDILQAAFVRGIEKGGDLRDEESVVAWFYRSLRNAIVDHYRHHAVAGRAAGELAREMETRHDPEDPFRQGVCECVIGLLDTLKPEYRQAIRTVDLNEGALADLAGQAGITPNNAAVRVHRAREALRKQVILACGACATHGCLDCRCKAQR